MIGISRGDDMGQSTYKVPGGKMLKIKLALSGGKIENVVIMGDFFLHPEETVLALEEKLKGKEPEYNTLVEIIRDVLENNQALLIGAKAEDIAKAIEMAS